MVSVWQPKPNEKLSSLENFYVRHSHHGADELPSASGLCALLSCNEDGIRVTVLLGFNWLPVLYSCFHLIIKLRKTWFPLCKWGTWHSEMLDSTCPVSTFSASYRAKFEQLCKRCSATDNLLSQKWIWTIIGNTHGATGRGGGMCWTGSW